MTPKRIAAVLLSALFIIFSMIMPVQAASFTTDVETVCEAMYMVNLDTGIVVFDKNANQKMYPASTTKIMTYIVAVENVADVKNTKVVIEQEVLNELLGTGSSLSGLEYFVGQAVTVYDLLNALMIKSGNDAAMLIANHVGNGSVQKFVDMMNEKAQELGCKNTHFMNPHGLHEETCQTEKRL